MDSSLGSRTCFLIFYLSAAALPPRELDAELLFALWPLGGSVEHAPIHTFPLGLHSRGLEGSSNLRVHQTPKGLLKYFVLPLTSYVTLSRLLIFLN